MDLMTELDELSHGLHRQRRLIELTVNRLRLARQALDHGETRHGALTLREVHHVLEHLHHEELFRAVLVAGIGEMLGTKADPDLVELIATVPSAAASRLTERRRRLCKAIEAADELAAGLELHASGPVRPLRRVRPHRERGMLVVLDAAAEPETLAGTAARIVQPSLRRFVRLDG